jgi:hypothetical protein
MIAGRMTTLMLAGSVSLTALVATASRAGDPPKGDGAGSEARGGADTGTGSDKRGGATRGDDGTDASRTAVDPLAAARALYVRVPEIKMKDTPLDEFIAWLKRETNVNVVASWRTLERAGVEQDALVTLELKNVLLRDVLRSVLDQVQDEKKPLAYRAEGNIITISTKTHLDGKLVTRTYDVQDLLVLVPSFESIQPVGFERVKSVTVERSADKLKNVDESVKTLVNIIVDTVFPDSWRDNGGSGTISYFNKRLVVRNTPEVHKALAGQFASSSR